MVRSIIVVTTLLIVDLLTKSWMFAQNWHSTALLPFLSLTLVKNTGMTFGIASNYHFFILISNAFLLGWTLYLSIVEQDNLSHKLWLFILAGGLGNFYDRVSLGYVRDFIHLHVGPYSWPVFNLADCFITVALTMIVLRVYVSYSQSTR